MILKGDCIEIMKAIKPNSVDAICTDPPYGLEFMGKEWDKLWDKREFGIDEYSKKSYTCSDGSTRKTNPVSRKLSNPNYKAGIEAQLWHSQWLSESYRVLKPGGSMLVMGGTRTSHRLACAIEDSGFIIKDTLMWIYGSGFPKAQDLGKMIDKRMGKERQVIGIKKHSDNFINAKTNKIGYLADPANKNNEKCFGYGKEEISTPSTDLAKHWDGFKVGGIKPAYEPIIWAVKPPEGSYVDNVLKWGVGAVNVDETRIGINNNDHKGKGGGGVHKIGKPMKDRLFGETKRTDSDYSKGRFPANIILSHHPECVQVGVKKIKSLSGGIGKTIAKSHFQRGEVKSGNFYANPNGLETVESWDCHPDCAVRILDEQSGVLKSGSRSGQISKPATNVYGEYKGKPLNCESSSGGASRFFYCAKASRAERNAGLEGMEEKRKATMEANKEGHFNQRCRVCGKWKNSGSPCKCENPVFYTPDDRPKAVASNNHPTVKPIKLFEWLIKLVTREGQIILDPFIGSGTTGIAAHNTGRNCVGIEKEEEYIEIAKRRATHWRSRPRQLEMTGG